MLAPQKRVIDVGTGVGLADSSIVLVVGELEFPIGTGVGESEPDKAEHESPII
jgi:hypothetical protein